MPDDQAYVVFDAANKPMSWPPEMHGKPTRIYKQGRSGGWEAFIQSLESLRSVEGVMIVAPGQSLSVLVSGLKAHFSQTFLDLMKRTLVMLTDDEDVAQVDALKRLYGFRTLLLSSWTEDHLMDFVGNIFQPPLEDLPETPVLEGKAMKSTQMADYYSMLGLQRNATIKEINAALQYYREYWAERARNPETRPKAEYSLSLISQAEALLSEPAKRERYDAVLATARPKTITPSPRGTRKLDLSPLGDELYKPTGWSRESGFTSNKEEAPRASGRLASPREKAGDKDDSFYRPPGWSREQEHERDREREDERRARSPTEKKDDDTVYQPPSWSREDEFEPEPLPPTAAKPVPELFEIQAATPPPGPVPELYDVQTPSPRPGPVSELYDVQTPSPPTGPVRELVDIPAPAAATGPVRELTDQPIVRRPEPRRAPDRELAEAFDDPELENLPGLGKRRDDPGGEPWPPRDWPPRDWVQREVERAEEPAAIAPPEDQPPEPPAEFVRTLPVAAGEPAPVEAEPQEAVPDSTRPVHVESDSPVVRRVAAAGMDIEIWASAFLSLDPPASFPADAGVLLGTRFEVGDRVHYVVRGTYSLGADAPGDRIGYYVRAKPGNVVEALQAAEAQVGAFTTVDLGVAVDLAPGIGRFFKVGAQKRPYAASPVVRLSTWQTAPPAGGDHLMELLRLNRWTVLAATGILFLGAFTWSLYHSLGGAASNDAPPLEILPVQSYIRADGVVLKWSGVFDKIAVYRVDAADTVAHWRMIGRFGDRRQLAIDPEPVRRPGRYRYLVVATVSEPRRTIISDIQALDVR